MAANISLLGGFSLLVDGSPVALHPGPARVIAALALHGLHPVGREPLASLLWPEKSRNRNIANLRGVLWRLPDAAKATLVIGDNLIRLEPSTITDVDLLDADCDCTLDTRKLSAPLLSGWYEDWVLAERDRISRQQMSALETRAEKYLTSGQPDLAIEAALASAMMEPLREAPHRLILRGHLAEGNVAEAYGHLALLRTLFADELGSDVSQETLEILPACSEVTDVRRILI